MKRKRAGLNSELMRLNKNYAYAVSGTKSYSIINTFHVTQENSSHIFP